MTKRIIACLDLKDGRVVKGVNFVDLKPVGDPVECAREYTAQGADEIVFLDITATTENRSTMLEVIEKAAKEVLVPLTVGGGIHSVEDFQKLLRAGADKVSINSAAVKDPQLIADAAEKFGSGSVVVAIDTKKIEGGYHVVTHGGQTDTGLDVVEWAKRAQELGAGELLLTSLDADGTKEGFDIELLNAVCNAVTIPVVASGGCGKLEHFSEVFEKTGADAALAASLFHFREVTVAEVKQHLREKGIR